MSKNTEKKLNQTLKGILIKLKKTYTCKLLPACVCTSLPCVYLCVEGKVDTNLYVYIKVYTCTYILCAPPCLVWSACLCAPLRVHVWMTLYTYMN